LRESLGTGLRENLRGPTGLRESVAPSALRENDAGPSDSFGYAAASATIGLKMSRTKQLFVLRHAKSSWDDPGLDDHDRPLAPRGLQAVRMLGEHLRARGIQPEQVLCSTARRTRETFDGVAPGGELQIEPDLYTAGTAELVERLRRVPPDTSSVMVIGHNPTMQTLILRLTGNGHSPESSDLSEVQRKFPTGALATLTFECEWSELGPGCAKLVALIRPKDLH
jgi:phosphohistidine phosphatase